jgi:cell division protein FtsL
VIEIYTVKRIENLGLGRRACDGAGRRCRRQLLLGATVCAVLIGYAWVQYRWVELGYRADQLDRQVLRLQELNRALQLELAALSAPERLDLLARDRLGLQPPRPEQVMLSVPQPAGEVAQVQQGSRPTAER